MFEKECDSLLDESDTDRQLFPTCTFVSPCVGGSIVVPRTYTV